MGICQNGVAKNGNFSHLSAKKKKGARRQRIFLTKRAPNRRIGLVFAMETQLRSEWIGAGIRPPRPMKRSQEKPERGMIGA